jgi:DNA-binding PadR family transcriptional regulator
MERQLLLLGLLRHQEMYGYQLNEFIDSHLGATVRLKKPTAYKLLNRMTGDGWIRFHEEQEGNRPVRRVYSITAVGETVFQDMIRENLATYHDVEFLGDISVIFLGAIPADEAEVLLHERRALIVNRERELGGLPAHPGPMQLAIEHQKHHLQAELRWLDMLLASVACGKFGHNAAHEWLER